MKQTIDFEPADLQAVGERVLSLVTGVIRALEIYDLGNSTVQSLVGELVEATAEYSKETGTGLSLLMDDENVFCNQEFLRLDRRVWDKVTRLKAAFGKLGVNQMELRPEVTHESLTSFFGATFKALADPEDRDLLEELTKADQYHASLTLVEGISRKGSGEEDMEEVCLRMFSTLDLLTEDFVYQATLQTFPPVVRIRRVLQRLVDLLDTHSDYIMALVNHGRADGALGAHLTRAALLAAALARTMGVERRRITQISLGVFLAHLPLVRLGEGWATAGQEQLKYVFDQTLADTVNRGSFSDRTAWNLAILHELQTTTLRSGDAYGPDLPISLDGRVAAICALFDRVRSGLTSQGQNREIGPASAVAKMAAIGRHQQQSATPMIDWRIVAMLVRLMGTVPPGTVVRMPDGSIGMVRQRPEIIQVTDPQGNPLPVPVITQAEGVEPIEPPEGLDLAPVVGFSSQLPEE